MDDYLFAQFLSRLRFSDTTRLRFYHDNHEGPSSRVGEEWVSEDEILRKIDEVVSSQFVFDLFLLSHIFYVFVFQQKSKKK